MKIFMVYTFIVHRTFSAICRPLAAPYPPQIHKAVSFRFWNTGDKNLGALCNLCSLPTANVETQIQTLHLPGILRGQPYSIRGSRK